MWIGSVLALAILLAACGSKADEAVVAASGSAVGSAAAKVTPRVFFNRGLPTYIVGTTGDDISDRAIAGQADLIRSLLTPDAKRIADTEIDTKQGPSAWPPNPIVYGGSHVNAVIAAIAPDLPFVIAAGKIEIGGRTFEGDALALITVVPARAGKYPEMLLYAGTGTPGIAEINAPHVGRVDAPIVIADAFGPLVVGAWKVGPDGQPIAQLGQPGRRVGWRDTQKVVAGVDVRFRFFEKSNAADDQAAIDASTRGIETAVKKLGDAKGLSMTVYVHPDQRSKHSLTGNGGAGHAVAFAKTLHVYYLQPPTALVGLVAHEGSHVLTPQMWPPPGSPLFGEGIAVWLAGEHAGKSLADLRKTTKTQGPIRELLGSKFRSLREQDAYPIGGILVELAVEKVGLANVRDHLYGATTATWDAACKRAGTTADALDAALAAALAK